MKCELSLICGYVNETIATSELSKFNYISTENMLPNKNGIEPASSLPNQKVVKAFKKGDILISNIRPYFKKIWLAEYNGGCSNDVLVIRAKKGTNKEFLYYLLSENKFFDYVTASSKGTKMPRGDKNAIMNYLVPEFEEKEQRKIAKLLGTIDKKIKVNKKINDNLIKVNKKINDNLEKQAQAIYKKMFINNPDVSMNFGTLRDIASVTMGQSPKGSSYNEHSIGEVFYQGRSDFGFRFPSRRLYTTEPKRIAEPGDVLLSVRAPVGDLNVAYEQCCIGRGLSSIHSKDGHSSFILYTMFSLKPQFDVFNGEGTVFGSINSDSLNAIPVKIPSPDKIEQFEAFIHPMDDLIKSDYEEICRLEVLRNSLLSKLMSGEIDVSDINL